jgi:transketolase
MASTPFIIGMRDAYFDVLYQIFKRDKNAIFVTADNGAPTLDKFASDFPDQYYQVGIAEQQMMGLAAGLAVEGRKVYTYAIAPFVTQRIAEFVKLDQCAMNVPIVNIGVGAGYSYDIMGPTHHTVEDIALMRSYPNLKIYSPSDAILGTQLAEYCHKDPAPQYIRFDRAGIPNLYGDRTLNIDDGMAVLNPSGDDKNRRVVIFATGRMVHNAMDIAEKLPKTAGINPTVVDVFRLKPLNNDLLLKIVGQHSHIVTYEEHYLNGGLGSIIVEALIDNSPKGFPKPILRIGAPDQFTFDLGGRQVIWKKYGLDSDSAAKKIAAWLK